MNNLPNIINRTTDDDKSRPAGSIIQAAVPISPENAEIQTYKMAHLIAMFG